MNTASVLAGALFVAAVSAYSEQEYQSAFTHWMHKNERAYTAEDFGARYEIFKKNMDFVQAWNADPTNTHQVELNLFADLSNEEYQRIYLGTRIDGTERLRRAAKTSVIGKIAAPAADTVDWRTKGAVTGIKDQGQCGSCWSFSATGSTEGAWFLAGNTLTSLSEQNLVDCSQKEGNDGCNGGLMDDAFQYIIDNKGIDTEESYPYTAKDGKKCLFKAADVGATIKSFSDVKSGDESALTSAIDKQPVSVAIDASHSSFQLYSSGVYNEKACSTSQLDHGVLAIGYGSDSGANYYLVKNSWGTSWGQKGYIWMTRNGSNQCGIATSASVPQA